jgi:hypothetical protein
MPAETVQPRSFADLITSPAYPSWAKPEPVDAPTRHRKTYTFLRGIASVWDRLVDGFTSAAYCHGSQTAPADALDDLGDTYGGAGPGAAGRRRLLQGVSPESALALVQVRHKGGPAGGTRAPGIPARRGRVLAGPRGRGRGRPERGVRRAERVFLRGPLRAEPPQRPRRPLAQLRRAVGGTEPCGRAPRGLRASSPRSSALSSS